MPYTVDIDQVNRSEWEQYAAHFADYSVYQTWPYQEVRAEIDGQHISRAVVRNENNHIVAICQVRVQTVKLLGLRIGYVQWGPLVRGENGVLNSTEAFRALRDAYVGDRVDVLRLVPNVRDDAMGRDLAQVLTTAGFRPSASYGRYRTFVVKVDDSEEGIRKRLRKSFRRDLKKAEKAEIQMQHGQGQEFCAILEKLYADSLQRKGFKGLELQQFLKAQPILSQNEKLNMIVIYHAGEAASIHVTSHLGDTAVVLLAASNEAGLSCGSSYLMWYEAAVTAFRQGKKWCDLGGIDPEKNPNVFQFKSRMGGEEVYHIGAFDACRCAWVRTIWRLMDRAHNSLKR